MMRAGTTMTTDLQLHRARDLFADNDVLYLAHDSLPSDLKISGAAWTVSRTSADAAHLRAFQHALPLVLSKLPGYVAWLLVGHTCWQDDNRVTRYRKLWGSLRAGGEELPAGHRSAEHMIESREGVRYFGAIRLDAGAIEAAVQLLRREPISVLVAIPATNDEVIESLIRRGWTRSDNAHAPSDEVVKAACGADGVVLGLIGAFDDPESGVVALAKPSLIERILDEPTDSR